MRYLLLFLVVILFILLGNAASAQKVTVDGYAFLVGETNHEGIKIIFERTVPDKLKDSTQTDSSGYFNTQIEKGIYIIKYFKDGFLQDSSKEMPIYSDMTIPNKTLEKAGLIGKLSGVIEKGIYKVSGDIIVSKWDTLIIKPGARFLFKKDVKYTVNGLLLAEGSENDSIIFTRLNDTSAWWGIKIDNSKLNNKMSYCLIEYSQSYGLFIDTSNCIIENILSRYNGEAGILVDHSKLKIINSQIIFNRNAGIIVYLGNDTTEIVNTDVSVNISNNQDGAISVYDNNSSSNGLLIIKNSKIHDNIAHYGGSGIFISSGDVQIENTFIYNNELDGGVGAINCDNGGRKLTFNNLTIVNNKSNGLSFVPFCFVQLKLYNSIISSNSKNGIVIGTQGDFEVFNSDFWNNKEGNIKLTKWHGVNVTVNDNGDSCDAYFNIQKDPMFVDADNGDFHLKPGSPCIDAGDNKYVIDSIDFDGFPRILTGRKNGKAIVDMGAYEFNPATPVQEPDLPRNEISIHPNPFNAFTNITLPDNIYNASLILFDVLGNKVKEINNIKTNNLILKRDNLQTGIYFYLLMDSERIIGNGKVMVY